MSAIEQFINEKVLLEHRDTVSKFRTLVKIHYPDIIEEIRGGTEKYYGVPVYKINRILITLSPTKQGITFNFSEGAKFKDKYNRLEGLGNKTLNLRIKNPNEFNEQVFRYYIDQAIKIDSER